MDIEATGNMDSVTSNTPAEANASTSATGSLADDLSVALVLDEVVPNGDIRLRIPRTGYVYDPRMMGHAEFNDPDEMDDDDDDKHPEQPGRIESIDRCLQAGGFMDVEAIVNSRAYYEHLSLYVHPKTPEAALLSGGGVIEAALAVARRQVKTSFANVRPPGHHAEPEEHMGFCFFNNVAIATKVVQLETSIRRIMILDWDVHHGNGTQRAFYDDPSVLYISLHRYEEGSFYPSGSFGSMEACGEGAGLGTSVNIPWPTKGMTDADYIYAFIRIVMPIAYEFAPELVIISAGFDAAEGDKLGECHVSPAGYAHMTHMLTSLANGRGGYNLKSISTSSLAVAEVLLGNPPPLMPEQQASEVATETVWQVSRVQSHYWKSINPKQCEPQEHVEEDTVSVTEILKHHRLEQLAERLQVFAIPFVDEQLQEAFDKQVLCSADFYSHQRAVLFIHDYGSLRGELEGATHINMDLEKSYMLDATRQLTDWVVADGFSLLDINLFPHKLKKGGNEIMLTKQLIKYLWDNYIELAEAEEIVIIASGHSCRVLSDILVNRSVEQKLKAVIQVVGSMAPARIPASEAEVRKWYTQHSLVIIPKSHPSLDERTFVNKNGTVEIINSEKPTLGFMQGLPIIKEFVRKKLNIQQPAPQQPVLLKLNGTPLGKITLPSTVLQFWDLGGQRDIRTIWHKYYDECHAVAYVVDASDRARLDEGWEVFDTVLSSPQILHVPLLLLANKQDAQDALSVEDIREHYEDWWQRRHQDGWSEGDGQERVASLDVMGVSALEGTGIKEAVDWLFIRVQNTKRRVDQ
ncbi:Histone deacetylase hda1 [Tulasnella sp. 330]|nr:Histone deacetylase hda1 [Tulasnella sp. 330]